MKTDRAALPASLRRELAVARVAALWVALVGVGPTPIASAGGEPGAGKAPPPAAPPSRELTVDRLFGEGPPIVGGGPPIASWRPGRDAWVEWRGSGGERALFEVDAATGESRPLVRLCDVTALRGKDEKPVPCRGIGRSGVPDHLFSKTGDQIVFPVGGDLVWTDVAGASDAAKRRMTRTLTPIADVRLSPDGRRVAFSRDNELFVASSEARPDVRVDARVDAGAEREGAAGLGETRLTWDGSDDVLNATLDWVYPEELDIRSAIEWSPDSTRIAFLRLEEKDVPRVLLGDPIPLHGAVERQRYPKAGDRNPTPRVGVVSARPCDGPGVSTPTWLDLGKDAEVYVPWFVWWPDGQRVLVAVVSRDQTRLELRLCDPSAGTATTWWTETDARWVDVPPPPKFLSTRPAALVRSRRDGFWRLWRAPLDGRAPVPLTPAGQEVGDLLAVDEMPAGSPAPGALPAPSGAEKPAGIAYLEIEDRSTLRTQVAWVPLDGASDSAPSIAVPTTVTDPQFSHHAKFSPTARYFVDAASRAGVPTTWTLRRADGTAVRPLADARTKAWDALALVPPEIRRLPGDPELVCSIRRPRHFDAADRSRRWPVVFHVYGGPGSRMVSDSFGGGGLFDATIAEAGIVVITVDGRGTSGRGKDFEATVHRRLGTCEVEDLVTAVERLSSEAWFDRSRVGVWGWSYGGTFAALAMGKAPKVFRAGAAVAPVTDWRLYDTIYAERYMDRPDENEAGYRDAAAVTWAKNVEGSLLLAHGLGDDNVHAQNTWRMVQALVAAGRPFDLQVYPQRGHGIEGANERRHVHRRIVEHFRAHLVAAPADAPAR